MADENTAEKQKTQKTDAEWLEILTPDQFHIMREKGTERPFTGALLENHEDGMYHCAACNAPLFASDTKFESGSGWPSFWLPASGGAVETHEDTSYVMRRIEATCANCGAHLGHVFLAAYALSVASVEKVLVLPVFEHAFGKPLRLDRMANAVSPARVAIISRKRIARRSLAPIAGPL